MSAASAYQQAVLDGFTSPYDAPSRNTTNGTAGYPQYQCRTTAIPVIDTPSPYCVVPGGSPRMGQCCSELSNGTSTPQLKPDCYVWCSVDLVHVPGGQDPLLPTLNAFFSCLTEGKGTYFPLACNNGTGGASVPTTSHSSTVTVTATTTTSTSTTASPAAPTTTRPSQAGLGAVRRGGATIAGLFIFQAVLAHVVA